jgi:hypothetical protein
MGKWYRRVHAFTSMGKWYSSSRCYTSRMHSSPSSTSNEASGASTATASHPSNASLSPYRTKTQSIPSPFSPTSSAAASCSPPARPRAERRQPVVSLMAASTGRSTGRLHPSIDHSFFSRPNLARAAARMSSWPSPNIPRLVAHRRSAGSSPRPIPSRRPHPSDSSLGLQLTLAASLPACRPALSTLGA